MKKMLIVIIVPYLLVLAFSFYIFYGPGVTARYWPIEWNGLTAEVPGGFDKKIYHDRGWDVYSLKKIFTTVKISMRAHPIDVSRLTENYKKGKVTFRYAPNPNEIYFIASAHKAFDVVYARSTAEGTLYISASGGSVFAGRYVVDKIAGSARLNGDPINAPRPSVPLIRYWTDILFAVGMSLPLFLIVIIFWWSGRRPAARHFQGDPVMHEEGGVYYTLSKKFRRQNSFCYLVLTSTRLMVFGFRKPIWVLDLHREQSAVKIEGKKIILEKEDAKITLKPADIGTWKTHLTRFLY